MIFGIIGQIILLRKNGNERDIYVFIFFLISNIFFLFWTIIINNIYIFALELVYLSTSVYGIYENIKRLREKSENEHR